MIFFDMDAPVLPDAVKPAGSLRIAMRARYNQRESRKHSYSNDLELAREVAGMATSAAHATL
jgi:hypothetical protein